MDLPSRIEIRRWLIENTRAEIDDFLADIRSEHGEINELDVRFALNAEQKNKRIDSAAESSILSEHNQRKAEIAADIQSQQRLYG